MSKGMEERLTCGDHSCAYLHLLDDLDLFLALYSTCISLEFISCLLSVVVSFQANRAAMAGNTAGLLRMLLNGSGVRPSVPEPKIVVLKRAIEKILEHSGLDEFGSLIGRVFRPKVGGSAAQVFNWSTSSRTRTTKDHLPCDFACKCGIWRSFFLPIFKSSSRCISGVIELIETSTISFFSDDPHHLAQDIFKGRASLVPPIFPH
ncbi:hypothetical protein LguiA_029269 [Lonicera macranthoides]